MFVSIKNVEHSVMIQQKSLQAKLD